jgi:hypothetical protein
MHNNAAMDSSGVSGEQVPRKGLWGMGQRLASFCDVWQ